MHFVPEMTPAEFPILLRRFFQLTEFRAWQKRFNTFDTQISGNPFYQDYIFDRFPLEVAMREFLSWKKSTGRSYREPRTIDEAALFALIGMVPKVYQRLSDPGKKRLEGTIRGALKDDNGISPLAFEMAVASHFMQNGFSIDFVDLEGHERFDLLATKRGIEVEVECKNLQGDAGRPIHRKRLAQIAPMIEEVTNSQLRDGEEIQLVSVVLRGRLEGALSQQQSIADAVRNALQSQSAISTDQGFSIEYQKLGKEVVSDIPADLSPENLAVLRNEIEELAGDPNANIVLNVRPGRGVIAVVLKSIKKTRVLDQLADELKKAAAEQTTGGRPAVLCARFVGLSDEQLGRIAEVERSENVSAIQSLASSLLGRDDWKHVHTLAFFGRGSVVQRPTFLNSHIAYATSTGGAVYHFKNSLSRYHGERELSIF